MKTDENLFGWVERHKNEDPMRLRLKYGHEYSYAILQVESRRKYASKLGEVLGRLPRFVFPTALAGEQSTSWRLAKFHASLINPGDRVIDLTAGLGIDALAMSDRGAHVTAVERDPVIAEALRANYASVPQIDIVESDCREYIRRFIDSGGDPFDTAFIDPARRGADGSRVYALDECEPDVVQMMPDLLGIARTVIIKASPMLDITHTLRLLPETERVITLGTPTECKELVIICTRNAETIRIEAVTIRAAGESSFSFTPEEETAATPAYAVPKEGEYVYDPYPSVMKCGAMRLLGARFGMSKLHANTHLWTSPREIPDFPGHSFIVTEVLPYASKNIKRYASRHPRVSITTRNFDPQAHALKAKLGVADGDRKRLFAVTAYDGSKLLVTCSPVSDTTNSSAL